jgi:glutamine cyclotransferase
MLRLRIPLAALFAALLVSGAAAPAPPTYVYQVVKTYPHDRKAFTQGLLVHDGFLYESTGLNGESSLRKVELDTGKVLQIQSVPQQYFAEGLAQYGSDLIQLTWQSQIGFVYDRATFRMKRSFNYPGEGWGLANDTTRLVMSDGTATIRFLDPTTLRETGRIQVTDRGSPVIHLNELEMVKGEIFANIWQTDRIARINPANGEVVGWIDLTGLLSPSEQQWGAVLNGIAYDARADRLFVTGKLWPKLFEIKLVQRR